MNFDLFSLNRGFNRINTPRSICIRCSFYTNRMIFEGMLLCQHVLLSDFCTSFRRATTTASFLQQYTGLYKRCNQNIQMICSCAWLCSQIYTFAHSPHTKNILGSCQRIPWSVLTKHIYLCPSGLIYKMAVLLSKISHLETPAATRSKDVALA